MPTTSNFGWTTPADTDLVKDGAAAIRTLGNGIDTSFLDLKGGTTDQVLAKNSNTDLDFKWVAQDDSNAIQNAIVDAKGDLISATAADTPARLGVGANGTILTADSAEATGLKWAAPSVSGTSWTLLNSGGTALTGAQTITVSGISGKNDLFIIVTGASSATAQSEISFRFNTDTATNYATFGFQNSSPTTYSATQNYGVENQTAISRIRLAQMTNNAGSSVSGYLLVSGGNTSGIKVVNGAGGFNPATGNSGAQYAIGGYWSGSATISSVSLFSEFGNFDSGTIFVYTSA